MKYEVEYKDHRLGYFLVEAENKIEAENKFVGMLNNGEIDLSKLDVIRGSFSVKEVKEDA